MLLYKGCWCRGASKQQWTCYIKNMYAYLHCPVECFQLPFRKSQEVLRITEVYNLKPLVWRTVKNDKKKKLALFSKS